MTTRLPLTGKAAKIRGTGPLAEAIARSLAASGAAIREEMDGASIVVVLVDLPKSSAPLADLPIEDYDSAFGSTMGRVYAVLHEASAALKEVEDAAMVVVTSIGRDADSWLAQAFAKGIEAVTGGFGAALAVPPGALRVNGVRYGGGSDAGELAALGETVAMLAGAEASYMNGMTVPVGEPVRSIEV